MPTNPSAVDFLRTVSKTAQHFGFQPIDSLKKDPACKNCEEKINHNTSANTRKLDSLHGMLTSGMCTYFDSKLNGIEGPTLFYSLETVPRTGETAINLQIFNVKKSIAEALLIQTTRSMLIELGYPNHSVRINSLGDEDSSTRYIRELTNFMRKRMDDLPAPARELMKEHVFVALMHLVEKQDALAYRSPNPLEYLSDPSRKHFREIIEYLDISDTSYEIDTKLLGHHECYSDALFAFDLKDDDFNTLEDEPILVRGGRYDTFVKHNTKQEVPAAGAIMVLRGRKAPSRMPRSARSSIPSVYVVQLGFGPKIQSLLLIDQLRQAGIPVYQDVVSDSLSAQLREAEAKKVRFTVIIGQKEFVDGTVILRDMDARSQENVPTNSLITQLKRVTK